MSQNPCTCPSYEGLTYDQVITVSGLLGKKSESRNCCESGGYICPTLRDALTYARRTKDAKERAQRGKTNVNNLPSSKKGSRILRKKKLPV